MGTASEGLPFYAAKRSGSMPNHIEVRRRGPTLAQCRHHRKKLDFKKKPLTNAGNHFSDLDIYVLHMHESTRRLDFFKFGKKMDWTNLTSASRFTADTLSPEEHGTSEPHITVFEKDAQRILYSTPFRRLQGKTKVHPFPIYDYLRTRLTHTVEVAHVGRVIASEIGRNISSRDSRILAATFSDATYAACLAHDLGNPPFGHVGEYAIQNWFQEQNDEHRNPTVHEVLKDDNCKNDFLHFDGNAQGFRIVTRLTGWRDNGGLQLSHSTIGAFSKYPYGSKHSTESKKKFGFFHEEEGFAKKIFGSLGMERPDKTFMRHPFAWIVEAADDICYLTTDVEDAFRTKHLTFTKASALLDCICKKGNHYGRYDSLIDSEEQDKISYLRSGAISSLIVAAINQFLNEEENILKGNYSLPLIETPKYRSFVDSIRSECRKNIYNERRKIETESAGITVILSLMESFGGMISRYKIHSDEEKLSIKDRHFLRMLPSYTQEKLASASKYQSMLLLVDYISGMTDRFALDLHSKLNGTSPTIGRML